METRTSIYHTAGPTEGHYPQNNHSWYSANLL